MSLNADPEAPYDPTNPTEDHPRRPSFTFMRTTSGASSKRDSVSPHPRPDAERRSSYDHKRDTLFDEYVARRKSIGEDDRLALPTRSRGNSLTQPASWELNMGDSPDMPGGGVQRGHSLVSVPEAPEAEIDMPVSRPPKTRPLSEDRQGLLGDRRISGMSGSSYVSRDSGLEPFPGLEVYKESRKRGRDS